MPNDRRFYVDKDGNVHPLTGGNDPTEGRAKFEVNPTTNQAAGWVGLLVVGFLAWLVFGSSLDCGSSSTLDERDTSYPLSSSSVPPYGPGSEFGFASISRGLDSLRNEPASGRYIQIVETRKDGERRPVVLVVGYERLHVVRVASVAEIPLADRERALDSAKPKQSEGNHEVFILHGDVRITVDELHNQQELKMRLDLDFGKAHEILLVMGKGPRAPPTSSDGPSSSELADLIASYQPDKAKKVYIVGEVESFTGPSQFEQSVVRGEIFDLRPKEYRMEEVVARAAAARGLVEPIGGLAGIRSRSGPGRGYRPSSGYKPSPPRPGGRP